MSANQQDFLKLGLIGHPVAHSLSPLMHRAAISHFRLDGTYDLLDVPPALLAPSILQFRTAYAGLNVTIPHKQAMMRLVDELTPEARIIQAVNTIRFEKNGRAVGHNTDSSGFLNALRGTAGEDKLNLRTVCLIGSGGAARAALWSVARAGASQTIIVARTQREARMMRDDFANVGKGPMQIILRSPGEPLNSSAPSLIVNCTPIGLSGEAVPPWMVTIMQSALRGQQRPIFFDMVYSRTGDPTPLVKQANSMGLLGADGLLMLVEQAALSFEFWTGLKVAPSVMASGLPQNLTASM